jgi:hypothetical protein
VNQLQNAPTHRKRVLLVLFPLEAPSSFFAFATLALSFSAEPTASLYTLPCYHLFRVCMALFFFVIVVVVCRCTEVRWSFV